MSSRCRLLINMTNGVSCRILREYENLSNMSSTMYVYNDFKQYSWYEIIIL